MPLHLTSNQKHEHRQASKIHHNLWTAYFVTLKPESLQPYSAEERMEQSVNNPYHQSIGTLDEFELEVLQDSTRYTFFDIRNFVKYGWVRLTPILQVRAWVAWFSSRPDISLEDWIRTGENECPFSMLPLLDRLRIAEQHHRYDVCVALLAHASKVLTINMTEYLELNDYLFARLLPPQDLSVTLGKYTVYLSDHELQKVAGNLQPNQYQPEILFYEALRQFLKTALNVESDKQAILVGFSPSGNYRSLQSLIWNIESKATVVEIFEQSPAQANELRRQGIADYFDDAVVLAKWKELADCVCQIIIAAVQAQRTDILAFFKTSNRLLTRVTCEMMLAAISTGNPEFAQTMLTSILSVYERQTNLRQQLINVPALFGPYLLKLREDANPFYQHLVDQFPVEAARALPPTRQSDDDDNDNGNDAQSVRTNRRRARFFEELSEDLQNEMENQYEDFFRKRARK